MITHLKQENIVSLPCRAMVTWYSSYFDTMNSSIQFGGNTLECIFMGEETGNLYF